MPYLIGVHLSLLEVRDIHCHLFSNDVSLPTSRYYIKPSLFMHLLYSLRIGHEVIKSTALLNPSHHTFKPSKPSEMLIAPHPLWCIIAERRQTYKNWHIVFRFSSLGRPRDMKEPKKRGRNKETACLVIEQRHVGWRQTYSLARGSDIADSGGCAGVYHTFTRWQPGPPPPLPAARN